MNINTIKLFISVSFVFLIFINTAQGATITVNAPDGADDRFDGLCSITEAIKSANLNSTSSECVTGSGTDTIVLSNDIVLNQVIDDDGSSDSFSDGRTGTPPITSSIIIQGNGFRIIRDPSLTCALNNVEDANEFRILFNGRTGTLALNNLSIENGCSDGIRNDSPATYGAGLLNDGQLSLSKTSFVNNKARVAGAGLASRYGDISTISNSSFIENSSVGTGAGIYTGGNIDIIENTTFYANFSGHNGGAIYIANDPFDYVRATINTIRNSSFHNNSAETEGGAIYAFGTLANLTNSLFSNNVSHNAFGAGSTDPFSNDSQDSDCQTYDSTAIINGSNNISHYGNSKSNCPGLINPRLDASSSAAIISDNGGSTKTVAMVGYNNAVDKAINGTINGQRELGVVGVRDIGAFESGYPELCVISSGQNIQTNGFTATVSTASELLAAMVCSKFNGNLTDTIKLANSITLNSAYETASTANGSTATPSISTPVIIDGQGFTLSRNNSLSCNLNNINDISEFRLLFNEVGNTLTLKHIKLVNGCADGDLNQGLGGALYNAGDLSVINTEFVQNHAITGGGIYHASGRIADISQSAFFANSAQISGGAIANSANIYIIKNSTFSSNSAINKYGGGIYNLTSIFNILNSTFSSNSSGIRGDAIYNNDTITKISNNLFHNHGNDDCIDKGIKFLGFNNLSDNATGGCPGLIAATLTTSSMTMLLVAVLD